MRWVVGIGSALCLLLLYMFQEVNWAKSINEDLSPLAEFFINRTIRFVVNDLLAVILIGALFRERKYVVFALWVQLFGLIFLLLPYFTIKYFWPAYNGPMVNFLHRLILNPTLLLLLIPALYYQRSQTV